MKRKVLQAAPIHPLLKEGLLGMGYELVVALDISQRSATARLSDVEGIITSTRLLLNKELIDAASSLKWIGRMGSGMEVIDVEYAERKGIACFSSPDGNANAVGEHALGMLLALTRKIVVSNIELKNQEWLREENRGMELEGKTIGIIGYGHTGKAFAKKLRGFDVDILVYDKYKQDATDEDIDFCEDLQRIYEQADILSFHVPLRYDTLHYFNKEMLSRFQKPIILINTSRGNVVEIQALREGLQTGKLKGVCLDVFDEEPLEKMSPDVREIFMHIATLPNAVLTPHIAGYTQEALYKMSKILLERIVTYV
ncbi:MAG TPA: NAD(P)-dependent oxidoreductase [Flavipsychrobacter sp.]|nr:NAD(P)-dependent oxidoreductase [Flavipsychrobacter sp.]